MIFYYNFYILHKEKTTFVLIILQNFILKAFQKVLRMFRRVSM